MLSLRGGSLLEDVDDLLMSHKSSIAREIFPCHSIGNAASSFDVSSQMKRLFFTVKYI